MSAQTFKFSVALLGLLLPGFGSAQQSILKAGSARSAIQEIETQFGATTTQWIAEIRGTGGQPQPHQWDVLTYNPRSTGLLQRYLVRPGAALDGGPENRRYPAEAPSGYFTSADLAVDSVAAFTLAEAEARKSKMGFDRCDYILKAREFSQEPIWKMDLIDASQRLVGSIFVSGTNGEVLRTIWVMRDPLSGLPKIVDSIAPSSRTGSLRSRPTTTPLAPLPPTTPSFPSNPPLTQTDPPPVNDGRIFREPTAPEPLAPLTPSIIGPPPTADIPGEPSMIIDPPPTTLPAPAPAANGGSIFREFPSSGGGSSRTTTPPSTDKPAPTITEPKLNLPPATGTTKNKRISAPTVPGQ